MAPAYLLSFPLFLSFLPSFLVPVTDVEPECRMNSHKIGVLLVIQNSVSLGSGWGSTFLAQCFESGGKEREQCHLNGRQIHTVEHKICYYVLLVIFFLSTPELVNDTYFIHAVETKLKTVDWSNYSLIY
jgi:hypothetical protein